MKIKQTNFNKQKKGIITKQDFEARKKEVLKLMKDQEVQQVENNIVSMRLRDKEEGTEK